MKVSLVYNPDAGDGVSSEALCEDLARGGFQVVHVLEKTPDLRRAMQDNADVVLVAGGDGTVARAAVAMKSQPLPLAIFPMGTANNIANTLGLMEPLPELLQRWKRAHIRKLDLGLAEGVGEPKHFVESVGAGLITAGIVAMDADPNADYDEADESLHRALATYRNVLASARSRYAHVSIDGERVQQNLLFLEVLNTRCVGARVVVSPTAEPDDGFFTVVMAGEEHRGELDKYLQRRLEGVVGHLTLPTRGAKHVQLHGWDQIHIDDEVRATPEGQAVDLHICGGMVNVLV